ncbi:MAG: response regulator [Betaproteobacteria bacterium]|nr:response regulator [Betaproteobacteria bacterium]
MKQDKKVILLVDDSMALLTAGKKIMRDTYKVYPTPSAEIMFDLLENITPDLILLDVNMQEVNGYAAIQRLKSDTRWQEIPVIFLTSRSDESSELEGLTLGAIDFITKPFSPPLLMKRIKNHLASETRRTQLQKMNENLECIVKTRTQQIVDIQNALLRTIADIIEFRDDITGRHTTRTQKYLELLIKELSLSGEYSAEMQDWKIDQLIMSAPLHDVGKISISDMILNKPGKLTDTEFEIMKGHVAAGVRIIKKIEEEVESSHLLRFARLIAASHHEKWDGSGYPAGLKGTDIPLEGRLMAIADVYDALVSKRPYKKPFSTNEAREIIIAGSGTHFDPLLVSMFERVADLFAHISRDLAY